MKEVAARRRELIAAVVLATLMLLAVSFAAGAQSAGHMFDWARLNGEPYWRALMFPVSVDGTILASTVVLYVDHRLTRPGHTLAYWLLGLGVLISVVANVLHDQSGIVAAKSISAVGPLALFGIFHLFAQFVRSLAGVLPPKVAKAPVVEKVEEEAGDLSGIVDSAEDAFAAYQEAHEELEELKEEADRLRLLEPVELPAIRMRAGRALRRPGRHRRLAGRRTTRKAPQAPTEPAPTAVPARAPLVPDIPFALAQNIGEAYAAGQLAVNAGPDGSWNITPTAGEPTPVLAAAQPREQVTAPRGARGSRVARSSRAKKAATVSPEAKALATQILDEHQGNISAQRLADTVGIPKTTAWRITNEWKEASA